MRIDHVIYATADLDAASEQIERELGLEVRGGGRHEGLGTHNRVVPLGGSYIELLAIVDEQEAASSELGRAVLANLARGEDRLIGWAVAVDDLAPIADRLWVKVTKIARQGMTAQLAGIEEAMREPSLPFFIVRDPGIAHPADGVDAGGISWIELSGDAERVGEWLGGADLPLRVVPGEPGVNAVGIGDRELRTG